MTKKKNIRGFTLIEISVSLAIVMTVLLSIITIFPYSLRINNRSANLSHAAFLAQIGIEQALSLGYDALGIGTIEAKDRLSLDQTSYLYHFQRQTDVDYLDEDLNVDINDNGLKKITVTVFWNDNFSFQETNYKLETIISQK
ncbi:MAG: type II secretion system protein [bacterium]|nr:type II secretion system protein [bacterium]